MTSKREEEDQKKALLDVLATDIYDRNPEIVHGRKLNGNDFEIPYLLKSIRKRLAKTDDSEPLSNYIEIFDIRDLPPPMVIESNIREVPLIGNPVKKRIIQPLEIIPARETLYSDPRETNLTRGEKHQFDVIQEILIE